MRCARDSEVNSEVSSHEMPKALVACMMQDRMRHVVLKKTNTAVCCMLPRIHGHGRSAL